MKNFYRHIAASLVLLSILATFPGCKKSSGGGDTNTNTSGYYLTATVAGKAWAANVGAPSLSNSPCIGVLTKSGNVSVAAVLGVQAQGKDSSAIALILPSNIQLNHTVNFDVSIYTEAAYALNTTGYNSLPANKGSGTITITTFDQTQKIIEGSFSGIFGTTDGGKKTVTVTDGKFRCIYTTDPNANPFPPNVKF